MGFYFDPGSQNDDEEPVGSFRDAVAITFVVFRVLAVPLAILFGAIGALILIFVLFTVHVYLGLGTIGLIFLAIVARGVWEAKNPPKLR